MAQSPTQRALAECRRRDWPCQVVERWNAFANVRVDLFGAIDIVAITEEGIMGIQVTSGSNHAARRKKALALDDIQEWMKHSPMEIWSYAPKEVLNRDGSTSKRKNYVLREERLERDDEE